MWRFLTAQICGLVLAAVISLGLMSIALTQAATSDLDRAGFSAIISGPVTAADVDNLRANDGLRFLSGSLDIVPERVYFAGQSATISRMFIFDSLDELVQTWGLQSAVAPGVVVASTGTYRALVDVTTARSIGIRPGDALNWIATNPTGESRDFSAIVVGTFGARSYLASTVHVVPSDTRLHNFIRSGGSLLYSSLYVRGPSNAPQHLLAGGQNRPWSVIERQIAMRRMDVPGGKWAWTAVIALAAILLAKASKASDQSIVAAVFVGCIPAALLAGQELRYGPGMSETAWGALGVAAVGMLLLTSPAGRNAHSRRVKTRS